MLLHLKSYRLDGNGRLVRLAEPPQFPDERRVVPDEDVFQVIWNTHFEIGHRRPRRVHQVLAQRYYGITESEVRMYSRILEGVRKEG